jgi:hypothetical protein
MRILGPQSFLGALNYLNYFLADFLIERITSKYFYEVPRPYLFSRMCCCQFAVLVYRFPNGEDPLKVCHGGGIDVSPPDDVERYESIVNYCTSKTITGAFKAQLFFVVIISF